MYATQKVNKAKLKFVGSVVHITNNTIVDRIVSKTNKKSPIKLTGPQKSDVAFISGTLVILLVSFRGIVFMKAPVQPFVPSILSTLKTKTIAYQLDMFSPHPTRTYHKCRSKVSRCVNLSTDAIYHAYRILMLNHRLYMKNPCPRKRIKNLKECCDVNTRSESILIMLYLIFG